MYKKNLQPELVSSEIRQCCLASVAVALLAVVPSAKTEVRATLKQKKILVNK
jgi:hypothetical protein